jgi:hypothetical protein
MKKTTSSEDIPKILSTREKARELFQEMTKENKTTFDLKNVEMISRSFANEWLNLEKEKDYKFKKTGMNETVAHIFKNADKKADKKNLKNKKYNVISIEKLISGW